MSIEEAKRQNPIQRDMSMAQDHLSTEKRPHGGRSRSRVRTNGKLMDVGLGIWKQRSGTNGVGIGPVLKRSRF
jgi:hypothetical protein